MDQYVGIDVSLEQSSVCVVDASGKVVREAKVASEPEALIAWLREQPCAATQIGLEALFPNEENPFPWMSEMIDLKKERNFFETRVIEYQSGGALSWD